MELVDLHRIFLQSTGICTDTRKLKEHALFFALKGENFNGNKFAKQALKEGCSFAIVDEEIEGDEDERIIPVEDVLKTLQNLANFHRKQFNIPVLGITGSNGKTTTKELIGAVLSKKYHLLITEGNLNNHLGVPFTLLRLNEAHEFAVIEMGASKPGDIQELVEIAEPNFGIITNIGAAHLEGFGSLEGVIQTKTEMYRFIEEAAGKLFCNGDDEILIKNLPKGVETIIFSQSDDKAYVSGEIQKLTPYLDFKWKFGDDSFEVKSHLVGSYNLTNFLAAICIGKYFGVSNNKINAALEEYIPSNNRSQITKTTRNTLLVDCYNANVTSMQAAIENFKAIENSSKLMILGSMKELGAVSQESHKNIMNQVRTSNMKAIFVGPEYAHLDLENYYPSTSELIAKGVLKEVHESLILLKGSRSIGLEKLIEYL